MNTVRLGRIFMFVLFVCPSPYVFAALGGSASPAMLIGLVMFGWWMLTRITTSVSSAHTRQPLRIAVFLVIGSIVASTAAAYARILPVEEIQAPMRGLAIVASFAGVCLFFSDGLRNRIDIEKIVFAFVLGGTFVAVIGLIEFFSRKEISPLLQLPGLDPLGVLYLITERNGFPRVAATASHPIEYGIILCVIWPFAMRHAVMMWSKRGRFVSLIPIILISLALPTTMSRTAVVAFTIVVATMWFTWSSRRRMRFSMVMGFGITTLFVVAPQVPNAVVSLFTKADEDVSISTRTEDYSKAGELISQHLFFGRGFKTFDPERYFFVDNQYLLSLIEIGVVGTLALIGLFVTAITLARNVKHTARDPFMRELGQCCASSLFAILLCFATFDTLSFPMISFTALSIVGISGAIWRVNRYENGDKSMAFASISTRLVEHDTIETTQQPSPAVS